MSTTRLSSTIIFVRIFIGLNLETNGIVQQSAEPNATVSCQTASYRESCSRNFDTVRSRASWPQHPSSRVRRFNANSSWNGKIEHLCVNAINVMKFQKNLVVIREPQGDLRTGSSEERSRFNNMFFPQRQPGRQIKTPLLFINDEQHIQVGILSISGRI